MTDEQLRIFWHLFRGNPKLKLTVRDERSALLFTASGEDVIDVLDEAMAYRANYPGTPDKGLVLVLSPTEAFHINPAPFGRVWEGCTHRGDQVTAIISVLKTPQPNADLEANLEELFNWQTPSTNHRE
jgi:hypothetical protein